MSVTVKSSGSSCAGFGASGVVGPPSASCDWHSSNAASNSPWSFRRHRPHCEFAWSASLRICLRLLHMNAATSLEVWSKPARLQLSDCLPRGFGMLGQWQRQKGRGAHCRGVHMCHPAPHCSSAALGLQPVGLALAQRCVVSIVVSHVHITPR